MAFGFEVITTRGVLDLADIRVVRRVWTGRFTTQSGSVTVPAHLTTGAFAGVVVNDGRQEPSVQVASGSVIWTAVTDQYSGEVPSSDFVISLYKVR